MWATECFDVAAQTTPTHPVWLYSWGKRCTFHAWLREQLCCYVTCEYNSRHLVSVVTITNCMVKRTAQQLYTRHVNTIFLLLLIRKSKHCSKGCAYERSKDLANMSSPTLHGQVLQLCDMYTCTCTLNRNMLTDLYKDLLHIGRLKSTGLDKDGVHSCSILFSLRERNLYRGEWREKEGEREGR